MQKGFARRDPCWRQWTVVLAVALVCAASASTIWHGEHGTDGTDTVEDCAVCQLRHHPAADLSAVPLIGQAIPAESFVLGAAVTAVLERLGPQIPARGPPA